MPPNYSKEEGDNASSSWTPTTSPPDNDNETDDAAGKSLKAPSVMFTNRLVEKGRYNRAMEYAKRRGYDTSMGGSDPILRSLDGATNNKEHVQSPEHKPKYQTIRSPVTTIRPLKPPSQFGKGTSRDETNTTPIVQKLPSKSSPAANAPSLPLKASVAKSREWAQKQSTGAFSVPRSRSPPPAPPRRQTTSPPNRSKAVLSLDPTPMAQWDGADTAAGNSTKKVALAQANYKREQLEHRVAEVLRGTAALSAAYGKADVDAGISVGSRNVHLKQTLLAAARTLQYTHATGKPVSHLSSLQYKITTPGRASSPDYSDPSLQQISLPSVDFPSRDPIKDVWDRDDFFDFNFGPVSSDGVTPGGFPVALGKMQPFMTTPVESVKQPSAIALIDGKPATITTTKPATRPFPKLRQPPSALPRQVRARAAACIPLVADIARAEDSTRKTAQSAPAPPDLHVELPVATKIEERMEHAKHFLKTLDSMDQPEVDAYFDAWQLEQEVEKRTPTAYEDNPTNPFNDDVAITERRSRQVMQHFQECVKCLID